MGMCRRALKRVKALMSGLDMLGSIESTIHDNLRKSGTVCQALNHVAWWIDLASGLVV